MRDYSSVTSPLATTFCSLVYHPGKYNGDISLRELVSEAGWVPSCDAHHLGYEVDHYTSNTMHHLTFGLMQHWKQHRNDFPVPFQTPQVSIHFILSPTMVDATSSQWGSMYPLVSYIIVTFHCHSLSIYYRIWMISSHLEIEFIPSPVGPELNC